MSRPKADYTDIDNFIVTNHITMKRPEIAQSLNCSITTIQKRFQVLQDLGTIEKTRKEKTGGNKNMETYSVTYSVDGIQMTKKAQAPDSKSAIAGVRKILASQSYDGLNSIEIVSCKKLHEEKIGPKVTLSDNVPTFKVESVINKEIEPAVSEEVEKTAPTPSIELEGAFEKHWEGSAEVLQGLNPQLDLNVKESPAPIEEFANQRIEQGIICYTSDKEICFSSDDEFISLGSDLTQKLIGFIHELFPKERQAHE